MTPSDVQPPPVGTDTPPPMQPEVAERVAAEFLSLVSAAANNRRPRAFLDTGDTIHYTELTGGDSNSPLAVEWKTFLRELPGCSPRGTKGGSS